MAEVSNYYRMERVMRSERYSWPVARVLDKTKDGHWYMISDPLKRLDELPIEFFSHELLDVDFRDHREVFRFCSEFGLPFLTSRYGGILNDISLRTESIRGSLGVDDYDRSKSVVLSMEEAQEAIYQLQECVGTLFAYMTGVSDRTLNSNLPWWWDTQDVYESDVAASRMMLHLGASNPLTYHNATSIHLETASLILRFNEIGDGPKRGTAPEGDLSRAVCNQLAAAVYGENPWLKCKGCGKAFQRYRGAVGHKPDYSRKPKPSLYCSKTCRSRTDKRNERASKKKGE